MPTCKAKKDNSMISYTYSGSETYVHSEGLILTTVKQSNGYIFLITYEVPGSDVSQILKLHETNVLVFLFDR